MASSLLRPAREGWASGSRCRLSPSFLHFPVCHSAIRATAWPNGRSTVFLTGKKQVSTAGSGVSASRRAVRSANDKN